MKGLILILSAVPMTIGMWMLCRSTCGECPIAMLAIWVCLSAFYFWFTPQDARL
jgi:hypothetical protein